MNGNYSPSVTNSVFDDDEFFDEPDNDEFFLCSYCDGDGWGIVGTDWDTDDAINGPYDFGKG
jgi:hypothetical protein